MSTTHCETGIVRIRVGLFNDILRFDYVLCIILYFMVQNFILNCTVLLCAENEQRKLKGRAVVGEEQKNVVKCWRRAIRINFILNCINLDKNVALSSIHQQKNLKCC